jgi:hypothetical protein
VAVAEVIPLENRLGDYRTDKRRTVAGVTAEIQESIREKLEELSCHSTPVDLQR